MDGGVTTIMALTKEEQMDVDGYAPYIKSYGDDFLLEVLNARTKEEVGSHNTKEHNLALIRVLELEQVRRFVEG